jgi:hypothetical protein
MPHPAMPSFCGERSRRRMRRARSRTLAARRGRAIPKRLFMSRDDVLMPRRSAGDDGSVVLACTMSGWLRYALPGAVGARVVTVPRACGACPAGTAG